MDGDAPALKLRHQNFILVFELRGEAERKMRSGTHVLPNDELDSSHFPPDRSPSRSNAWVCLELQVKAAGTCEGEKCVEDYDVCEPIILRQNVGKRNFLVFCNFTQIPDETYYEIETRAATDVEADISSVLDWRPTGPFNETGMLVTGLRPFTHYEARAVLRKADRILGKSKSIFVSTNISEEAPSDSPRAVFISNPENGVIAIAWKRPMVLNAPLLEYQLTVEAKSISPTYFSIEPELNFYQIRGLKGPIAYTVSLRAKNRYGMGPPYSGRIALTKGSGSKQTSSTLIVAVGKGLHMFDTSFMFFSNEEMPSAENDIIDMAVYLKGDRLFFADKLSRIFVWHMKNGTVSKLWQSKDRILAMDYNWLSHQLYVLHSNNISIVSTGDNVTAISISHNNEASPGSTLTVDPLNGYMFVLTDGILYRSELPSDSGSLQFQLLRADVRGFAVVPNTQALFVANSSSIVQLSYDWSNQAKQKIVFVSKKRKQIIKGGLMKDLKKFYFVSSYNGTLVSLEFMKKKKKYQTSGHEFLTHILPKLITTSSEFQPAPVPYRPPDGVSAVCWRRQCAISWKPPPVNAGATKSAWQKWNYVLIWRDLTSSKTYKEVVSRQLSARKTNLKPSTCYEVSVAAIGERNEGPASKPGVVCTNGLKENSKLAFFFVRENKLFLEERTTDGNRQGAANRTGGAPLDFEAKTIFSLDRFLWAGDLHGGVHFLSGGNWRALTSLPRVQVFALEPLGRTLYFVSSVDGWIYRWREHWSQAELLIRSSGVRGLSIDSKGARLFWCSGRQVFASGLHGENETEQFSLPADKWDGASLAGVLWDAGSKRLLLAVQSEYRAWSAAIWRLAARGKAEKVTMIRPIKNPQSLRVVGENLFWSDGQGVYVRHSGANLTGRLLENVTAFHVERLSAGAGDPLAIFPCPVAQLRIEEKEGRSFRLRWNCSGPAPPRQKFKVTIAHTDGVFSRVTHKFWTELRKFPPHSPLNVSVQPFTRWIHGEAGHAILWSPFADPEAPKNLRFLQHQQRDLQTGSLRLELQSCWDAQEDAGRPIAAFQLQLACPACPAAVHNVSRRARCATFEVPRGAGAACVELKACGPRGSCGPNTTIGCADGPDDMTNSTSERVGLLMRINNASDTAVYWGKNFMVMSRGENIMVSAMNTNESVSDEQILHKGEGNISHLAADWDRYLLVWTEELAAGANLWAVNLMRYESSIRRLQNLGGPVEKLQLFPSTGELQWRVAGANATYTKVSELQGLSRYANDYEDASPEHCSDWAAESVECTHSEKSFYQLRIQPGKNRIIEFSPEKELCRYRMIKGSATSVKSLQLIHTCFVPDTTATMAPSRFRRSAVSSSDNSVVNVLARDRRTLLLRRTDGSMIGQERYQYPIRCKKVRTKLEITHCGRTTLNVRWTRPKNATNIIRAAAQIKTSTGWQEMGRGTSWTNDNYALEKKRTQTSEFEELTPNTLYKVRLALIVCTKRNRRTNACVHQLVLHEPDEQNEDSCGCVTKSDVPKEPPKPNYQHLRDRRYRLTWDSPEAYGSKIFKYFVDTKDATSNKSRWATTRESQNNSADLAIDRITDVRIRAQNGVGISNPSPSLRIVPNAASAIVSPLVVSLAAILFCVLLAIVISTFCWYRRKKSFDHRRSHLNQLTMQMEMRNLAGSPGPTEVNALYANATKMEAIDRLPRISRHQLELASNKYLGAGAFGQVWEGLAKGLFPNEPERNLPVAMKTLRRGATSQEREDFLQEALLMSNFNHEHIVRLLGVCLDGEPQFIILELMNKGDLKSYLRASRPSLKDTLAALSVPNLLGIILDVAKGCAYLEEQHFVHRDIAARNCLVTYRPDGSRVTKIGDFGLARDVYRNDYYRNQRKEAMLPVRWMSPEALVDGFFSSQSDVWAFGVLCWEVMTLGQQPYAARTHSQVMRFVRAGGMLDRPNVCPEPLYQLIVLSWSFSPQLRPTFSQILNSLYGFDAQTHDPYSPFAQPVYFQNYATNDFTNTLANSSTRSSGDSSECISNPPCLDSAAASCYETPLSRPYLDLQSDAVHYVNSRVVGLPPLGCDTADRKRPLSIDACRSPGLAAAPQMVCLQPPATPPGRAEILMTANGDINYRSIRVEEPNEYHTPNPVPILARQVSEPQAHAVPAAVPAVINGAPSWQQPTINGAVNGGSASSGTIRSSVSSNGDSSLTSMSASTGSRLSSVGFAMANGTAIKSLTATVNGRPLMAVSEPTTAPKANGEYASRSYDRL